MRRLRNVMPLALTALLTASSFAYAESDATPELSGKWQLNQEASDDPREKMREAMEGRRGRGGFGGGGALPPGGGRGDRDGGFGRRGGSREEMREQMEAREAGWDLLTIDHQEPEVRITFADERQRLVHTDKRVTETELGAVWARWKKGLLIVTTETERGKRTETWQLSRNGTVLTVTTEMAGNGRMPSITFNRVYEPVETASADAG